MAAVSSLPREERTMADRRVVVITGAASGMGAASARAFAAQGDTVVCVERPGAGARAVAGPIGASEPFVGDVSDSAFCGATIDRVREAHGRVDVLVNAAGTIHRADSRGTDDADWRRVMGVNVDGTYFMCRAVIEPMRARGGGAIVNFGSIWGEVGAAGVTAYCVSKGAVHQLTRALALDHVGDGIRVNAVAPGEVNTPMLASQREVPPTAADLQALADATIPMKRLAEPEEIASVVVFLASPGAGYMTGAIVPVDGGYTVR
jgi:meso-butanediol dehydrogenase/(S,S)-butanediol dehydrogenase/diacetyl reductase